MRWTNSVGRCDGSSKTTGVRRETAGEYLKAAGIAVRPPGGWVGSPPAKAAKEVSPAASACEPYRELIELSRAKGRNAMAIWQDLVATSKASAPIASAYLDIVERVGRCR